VILIPDRNGRKLSFVYDVLNRQTKENWLNSSGNPIWTTTSTYDAAGQLTKISDPKSTINFAYDALGQMIKVNNGGTPQVPFVTLDYTYDNNGNLTQVGDAISNQASGITAYSYDSNNRVTQITNTGNGVASKSVNMTYDALGRVTSLNRYSNLSGNQLVTTSDYIYDNLNRLTTLTHSNTNNQLANYGFVYDAAGRITQITDIDGVNNYSYDTTNQLTGADHTNPNNPDESYTYDANGNRVSSSVNGNGYVTGANNRPKSDGTYNYQYDAEGNLISQTKIATGTKKEFQWDYRNRLVAVVDKNALGVETQRVEFTYDAMNRRIAKTVDITPLNAINDGVVTHFVYDRDHVVLEFVDNDGTAGASQPVLDKRYFYGTGVDQILAQESAGGEVTWLLTDHLGTVRDLVDNGGNVVNHLQYDSYGNVVFETFPAIDTRYLFTGREFDSETGLYYYRARYYDASVGRFISEDPIGFDGGDANLSRYVLNNPLSNLDPFGRTSDELIALLNIAQRRDPAKVKETIYHYPKALDYETAFVTGLTWFYLITEPGTRTAKIFEPPITPNLDWLLNGLLKVGPQVPGAGGQANFRPAGDSGSYPTIDLKPERGKAKRRHLTPNNEFATEIKFLWKNQYNCKSPPVPLAEPEEEPDLKVFADNIFAPKPVPTPIPTPERPPEPIPVPWWIPPFLSPRRDLV